jgi:chromosome segregation protein
MLLKKLEMCGFKSFADKTEFDFQSGVTAFVGPNGCGKSNVVDAVRWILGEQSAKAIRGSQMLDVIFNGTANRRSLGYAEASLTFLNDRGILPVEYTEVCVTRRLYRSGESEYFLNRQPCRLRDIRQLFMDTGVGVDTYSIIEQGKVSRFIEMNSRERREIFEEAAGISRYKAQRREAQNRLERTKLNLQKVDVRLEEQRKQLRSIKYQAAKAKRFREYTARLRDLAVALAVKNYKEWDARRLELEIAVKGLNERLGGVASELGNVESLMVETDARIGQLERHHLQRRDELHQTQAAIEAANQSIVHNDERIREFQNESERSTKDIWALTEKLRQTREDLAAAERNLEAIRETIVRQAQTIAAETEKSDAAGRECERLATAIEEWKNRTIQVIERATTLRNELNHMDSTRRQQLSRRSRLQGQLAEKANEIARMEQDVQQLAGQRDEISGRLADRSTMLHEKEGEVTRLDAEAQDLEGRLTTLRHREAQCVSRRDMLQDIEMRAEDVDSGVKRLLRGEDPSLAGLQICGMVADLLRADLKYAAAVESALGDAVQHIVTLTQDSAGAAAALLRADRSGRAGMIPVSRARAPEMETLSLYGHPGVLGRASELVRYRPEFEPVVRHLLGHTWIVENLETALRLSNGEGAGQRFVTLDGERVEPTGVVVGGEPLPRVGLVSRKSELDEIVAELKVLTNDLAVFESDRGRIAEHVDFLRSEIATLRKEIEQGNLDKLSNENEILNLRRRQKSLGDESALINSELAEIDAALAAYDLREKQITQELEGVIQQRDQLHVEMENARRSLTEQQEAVDRLRQELTRLKVEIAEKEARRGGLEQEINTARQNIIDIELQMAAVRARIDDLRAKTTQAEQEISRARIELERLAGQKTGLENEIAGIRAEQAQAQAMRAEYAEKAKSLRIEQDSLRQQAQKVQLEEQEHRVRMEALDERLFSEYGVRVTDVIAAQAAAAKAAEEAAKAAEEAARLAAEAALKAAQMPEGVPAEGAPAEGQPVAAEGQPVAAEAAAQPVEAAQAQTVEAPSAAPAEAAPVAQAEAAAAEAAPAAPVAVQLQIAPAIPLPPTDLDWNTVAGEIEQLRDKIRKMGGVNEESIDEESSLEISITQTEAQRNDLVKAIDDLQEVIRKLNRISRERFMKTFEDVRAHFQETFRRLFGGGRCDLILQEDEPDVLEAGIEVLACPPGKELRSITLMSGGEKTMTTIALLFAVFRAKPSPFCILDEIDAALDEANIDRFTTMLIEEFTKNSQFIIITHSKRTVGIADILYGITMQEKGVSKKVSVNIEQAVQMTN